MRKLKLRKEKELAGMQGQEPSNPRCNCSARLLHAGVSETPVESTEAAASAHLISEPHVKFLLESIISKSLRKISVFPL